MNDAVAGELLASLKEMVGIYGEEERLDVLVPYDEQPECIKRAMDAIAAAEAA